MNENQTVKDRLIQFIAYLNIGQGRFEKNCGLANAYVANIRKSITPKKLQQIAQHYPELNIGWLITGEGAMLRTAVQQTSNGDYSPNVNGDGNNVNSDKEIVDRFLDELSAQRNLVERTISMLEKRDTQVDRLITMLEKRDR